MVSIKSPQNLGAAGILCLIGVLGLVFGSDLEVGTAAQMGPGYFPMVLSWGLVFFGVVSFLRALTVEGPPIAIPTLRPIAFILAAVLVFGGLVQVLGMALIGAVIVVIAAYAQTKVGLKETALLAIALSAFAVGVFVYALGLPLSVWGG